MVVATLNLFNNPEGRWPERQPLVVEQAAALAPDVLCLQEVDRHGQVERLVEALNDRAERPYRAVTLPHPDEGSVRSLAVISRLPLAAVTPGELPRDGIALRVAVETPDGVLDVFTTHLHFSPTAAGSAVRAAQARRLLAWVGELAGEGPVVVAGDLNTPPGGQAVEVLKQALRSAYECAHGAEPASTHPTPFVRTLDAQRAFGRHAVPWHPATVDYVLVGGPVEVLDAHLCFDRPSADGALYPSDHFGVAAAISFEASHTAT